MKISNVADLLVETLLVVGDSLNAVTETIRASSKARCAARSPTTGRRWSTSSSRGRSSRRRPKSAAEQVRGFGLYVLKAVMSGRGDELVDLARANLLR